MSCSATPDEETHRRRYPRGEPIHEVLIARIAEFHDDVIDSGRESGVANKGEPKSMALLVTVSALTEGDHRVRTKGVENALDRLAVRRRLVVVDLAAPSSTPWQRRIEGR